jgi:hypothetical protein
MICEEVSNWKTTNRVFDILPFFNICVEVLPLPTLESPWSSVHTTIPELAKVKSADDYSSS